MPHTPLPLRKWGVFLFDKHFMKSRMWSRSFLEDYPMKNEVELLLEKVGSGQRLSGDEQERLHLHTNNILRTGLPRRDESQTFRCQRCCSRLVKVVSGVSHGRYLYRAECSNNNCTTPQLLSTSTIDTLPPKENTHEEWEKIMKRPFTI